MRMQRPRKLMITLSLVAGIILPAQVAYAETRAERYARIHCTAYWQIDGYPGYGACYEDYYNQYIADNCGGDPNNCS